MSSEPSDPIESATKGFTKGILEYTEDKLKDWIRKFKNKELAFIEDQETIDVAKEVRKIGEYKFFRGFIKDKELEILYQMGLTLRGLEKNDKPIEDLIKKIKKKYKREGLHKAFFVQNGIFTKYVGILFEIGFSKDKIKLKIKDVFDNIDKKVMFVQNTDNTEEMIDQRAREIITKIDVDKPTIYVISGSNTTAMTACNSIKDNVMSEISDYTAEEYSAPAVKKQIFFLIKNNNS